MKEQFREYKFHGATQRRIVQAESIIAEYASRGMSLTLRQIYYQFVSRDLIKNNLQEYKRLGDLLNKARLAGLIDWNSMEDRTRGLRGYDFRSDTQDLGVYMQEAAESYGVSRWEDQPYAPEIWIEKDALTGVIEPICSELRLDYFSCRGYVSQSEQYKAGKRFADRRWDDRIPVVFHLGDHDPSGLHMTVDNRERFAMFAEQDVEVVRLALNQSQVERYNPPPNPAKMTDSRAAGYVERYGQKSWELDALNPDVIAALIRDAVEPLIDQEKWDAAEEREREARETLRAFGDRYDELRDWMAYIDTRDNG